jgi:hypothetical protein
MVGKFLTASVFFKEWVKAEKAAGVRDYVPYALCHISSAWSLLIEIHPLMLRKLIGNVFKRMVHERYVTYIEKLEKDREQIAAFFGKDFIDR